MVNLAQDTHARSGELLRGAQDAQGSLTSALVQTFLHQDRLVRVATASLAFNVGAWVQRGHISWTKVGGEEVVNEIREDSGRRKGRGLGG